MNGTIKEEANKNNEETLIKKEEIQFGESSSNSKQRLIVFIILMILFLIIFISMILLFSLNNDKNENDDNIEELTPLVFNSTSGNHTHTIIFMPGYSNTPEDFRNVFTRRINFTKKNDTNIVILRSPMTYVSVIKSKEHSWFDIYNFPLDDFSDINLEELKKSAKVLEKVINNEANFLNGSYDKIIVGGHSQGAAISLYQAYTAKNNYGGIFAFSGFLSPGEISEEKRKLKVYFGYGDNDDIILPNFINKTLERVMDFEGFDLHIYKDHKHSVHKNETRDAGIFLDNIIN